MLRASCILCARPKATWERQLDMHGRAWSGAPCLASIPRTRASGRPTRSRWQTARPSCSPTPRSLRSFPITAWLLSLTRRSSRRNRTRNRRVSPAARTGPILAPVRRARTAVPVRAPPLAVDLRVVARRTAVPAATQARVASRLPRRRVSTVGS